MSTNKINRVLLLFHKLIKGEQIHKVDFARTHDVSERSVERDIEDIRIFLSEIHSNDKLIFDKLENVYYLLTTGNNDKLNNIESIVLLKIILGTRALVKKEVEFVIKSLRLNLSPQDRKEIIHSIQDEINNYISPVHNKPLLDMLNNLNKAIINKMIIKIDYVKDNGSEHERVLMPVAFIFSDFYFYLIAFIEGKEYKYPAFFRVDRIKNVKNLNEKYDAKFYQQYNTGNMRNYLQFMYTGKLLTVKIRCKNCAVEAMRDRLPNNWLVKDEGEYKIYKVKVFGEGFIKWVLSQGSNIEILEPIEIRDKLIEKVKDLGILYMIL